MANAEKLSPCPFCGGEPSCERAGTPRVSCLVQCTECGCRLESNENGAGEAWNTRASSPRDRHVALGAEEAAHEATKAKLAKAREALGMADALLNDLYAGHRHPDSHDYNGCEKDPCCWCDDVDAFRNALKTAGDAAGSFVDEQD